MKKGHYGSQQQDCHFSFRTGVNRNSAGRAISVSDGVLNYFLPAAKGRVEPVKSLVPTASRSRTSRFLRPTRMRLWNCFLEELPAPKKAHYLSVSVMAIMRWSAVELAEANRGTRQRKERSAECAWATSAENRVRRSERVATGRGRSTHSASRTEHPEHKNDIRQRIPFTPQFTSPSDLHRTFPSVGTAEGRSCLRYAGRRS